MGGSSTEGVDLRVLFGEDIPSSVDDLFSFEGDETMEEEAEASDASSEGNAMWAPFLRRSGSDESEEKGDPSSDDLSDEVEMEVEELLDSSSGGGVSHPIFQNQRKTECSNHMCARI